MMKAFVLVLLALVLVAGCQKAAPVEKAQAAPQVTATEVQDLEQDISGLEDESIDQDMAELESLEQDLAGLP